MVVKHPGYSYQGYSIINDIALWILNFPVFSREYYKLDRSNLGSEEGLKALSLGWGRTSVVNNQLYAENLKGAELLIISSDLCARSYPGLDKASTLCTKFSNTKASICFGDSGSPLLVGDIVIGISSFVGSKDCSRADMPPAFARVYPFIAWIEETMKVYQNKTSF